MAAFRTAQRVPENQGFRAVSLEKTPREYKVILMFLVPGDLTKPVLGAKLIH
jgi:hypothetical protein